MDLAKVRAALAHAGPWCLSRRRRRAGSCCLRYGKIRDILGLYRDNGKENRNYYSVLGLYRGYINNQIADIPTGCDGGQHLRGNRICNGAKRKLFKQPG